MMDNQNNISEMESTKQEINGLLKKSAGDIGNLSYGEATRLQKLLAQNLLLEMYENCRQWHPNAGALGACLLEECYRRRITQVTFAKQAGISLAHLSKVINGRQPMGIRVAKAIYRNLGIDGNFILENA